MIQLKKSRGKACPPARVTRDHYPWNALVIVLRNAGPHPQQKHRRTSQLWSEAPEVEKLVWVSEAEDRKLLQFGPTSCEQAKSRCPYIPGSPRSLALLRVPNPRSIPLGRCMIHLRLWSPPTGPGHSSTPHPHQLCLPCPSLSPAQLIK